MIWKFLFTSYRLEATDRRWFLIELRSITKVIAVYKRILRAGSSVEITRSIDALSMTRREKGSPRDLRARMHERSMMSFIGILRAGSGVEETKGSKRPQNDAGGRRILRKR
jgi:hypothetical protein